MADCGRSRSSSTRSLITVRKLAFGFSTISLLRRETVCVCEREREWLFHADCICNCAIYFSRYTLHRPIIPIDFVSLPKVVDDALSHRSLCPHVRHPCPPQCQSLVPNH